jgi:peptidoglycan DL-endopeptidase CwlO
LRLTLAALVTASLTAGTAAVSLARPTQQDLQEAKAKLGALNQKLDILVEEFDAAKVALAKTEQRLAEARATAQRAEAQAEAARTALAARVRSAYEGSTSALEVILGATSFSQLSDRMEYLSSATQEDENLATLARVKGQQAQRAEKVLAAEAKRRTTLLHTLDSKKSEIESGIGQQQALIQKLEKELAKPVYTKPKPPPSGSGGSGGSDPAPGPGPDPGPAPGPGPGAGTAVAAAYSVIGVPYKWGGSSPEEGFDCSGLTMWSWAQAGVGLPHSSAAQYAVLPHVSQSELQPGDLVFFYSPIHHVGIYVGGGMMIHSPHTGAFVELVPLSSEPDYVGAGRPG